MIDYDQILAPPKKCKHICDIMPIYVGRLVIWGEAHNDQKFVSKKAHPACTKINKRGLLQTDHLVFGESSKSDSESQLRGK